MHCVLFQNVFTVSDTPLQPNYQIGEFCTGATVPSYKKSTTDQYFWPAPNGDWLFGYENCGNNLYVEFLRHKNDAISKFWEITSPTFSYYTNPETGWLDTDSVNTYGLAHVLPAGYQLGDENLSYFIFQQSDGTWGVSSEIDGILEATFGTGSCVLGLFGDIEIKNELGNDAVFLGHTRC